METAHLKLRFSVVMIFSLICCIRMFFAVIHKMCILFMTWYIIVCSGIEVIGSEYYRCTLTDCYSTSACCMYLQVTALHIPVVRYSLPGTETRIPVAVISPLSLTNTVRNPLAGGSVTVPIVISMEGTPSRISCKPRVQDYYGTSGNTFWKAQKWPLGLLIHTELTAEFAHWGLQPDNTAINMIKQSPVMRPANGFHLVMTCL